MRASKSRIGGACRWLAALGLVAALAGVAGSVAPGVSAAPLTGVDLSKYVRVGRFDLPEPTRTAAPPNSLLAQEASAVTYDWDTDTLFVVGDGGTSVVQVTKTGAADRLDDARARQQPAGHRRSTTPRASPTSAAASSS